MTYDFEDDSFDQPDVTFTEYDQTIDSSASYISYR